MRSAKKQIYNLEIHQVLNLVSSSPNGISDEEATRRLKKFGRNVLSVKKPALWRRILEPFASYFVAIIIVAAIISLFEQKWFEAIIISFIIIINALIYYFQQFSVNRVLKTLRKQDKQTVFIIRKGTQVEIASELIVPGDIVHIKEGLKIPADGRLIDANHVQCDESMLTGESLPVHKQAGAIEGKKALYSQHNMLFKGTFIRGGSGIMVVTSTGDNTELGSINRLTGEADEGRAPIEQKIDKLTKRLLGIIGSVSAIVFVLAVLRGTALEEALRFTLSLTVSAVPEGLPVAITLVLIFSARRMAKQKALVKKIGAMETMGAITLIATDKTGTITQNKLSIAHSYSPHENSDDFHEAIFASLNGEKDYHEDPLDDLLYKSVAHARHMNGWKKVKEYPFNQELRLSATAWTKGNKTVLFTKGAPEHIISRLKSGTEPAVLKEILHDFTSKGYRTIGFAQKNITTLPEKLTTKVLSSMRFNGFIGLSDQVRPGVHAAIAEAHVAGIKVIMMTGDHTLTAAHVAHQVGISKNKDEVAESTLLTKFTPGAIRKSLEHIKVFGRVLPEHKFALLQAVKGHEITAMTGDGVNDIPALVEADAGLAMGSGTDAAKDASDIVLLNSDFRTIVSAVRAGRTVLANIRKMVVYLLGTSGGEVLTMLTALLIGIPLPITAVMVLWVNLATDGVSVIPLGLSPSEAHHMSEPPNKSSAPLLNKVLLSRAVVLAVVMAVMVLFIFKLNLPKGEAYAQTAAFLSLIVIQWANAFNMNHEKKSWIYNIIKPNFKLIIAIGGSIIVNILIFTTPLKQIFGLTSLDTFDALIAIVLPVSMTLLFCDLHKFASQIHRKRQIKNLAV